MAVLFMINVHVLNLLATPALEHGTWFGQIISFLGSIPAAPVFMTLMGASFVLAPPASPAAGLRRGARLLATGYALNLARFVAPLALARWLDPAAAAQLPYAADGLLPYLLIVDILQFAGLAYLVLTALHAGQARPALVLALLVAVTLSAPWLWGTFGTVPVLGRITDLLWGARGELVAFPLFPWLAYPLTGYLMGQALRRAPSADWFFARLGRTAVPLLLVGGAWAATNPAYHFGDYWHTGPGGIVVSVGFIGVWLWGWHWLAPRLRPAWLVDFLHFGSRHVTTLYLIQWTLIGWLTLVVGYKTAGLTLTLALMAEIVGSTFWLAKWWAGRANRPYRVPTVALRNDA